jgi:hypothetical protein
LPTATATSGLVAAASLHTVCLAYERENLTNSWERKPDYYQDEPHRQGGTERGAAVAGAAAVAVAVAARARAGAHGGE